MSSLLRVEALTPASFAPYGEVIEAEAAATRYAVNAGTATRYHDLARIDTGSDDGRTAVSIFRAAPRDLPFRVAMLERHPLGSQAFVPLGEARYVVVVADDPAAPPRAFLAARQGINYRRGVWHHPLIVLDRITDFLCIDRAGPGMNCEEVALAQAWLLDAVELLPR